MFSAVGLRTHIWNNMLKSVLLLAAFPILLVLIALAFALLIVAPEDPSVSDGLRQAFELVPMVLPGAIAAALIWFAIAYLFNQFIVDAVTGARKVERSAEPRVWNLLENLAISRGLATPTLRIIETEGLNAYASGIGKNRYSVTVTRGLIEALSDQELEAVLAHELTHIRNKDVQLLVICGVFVGVISLVGDLISRGFRFGSWGGSSRRSGSGSGSGGGSKGGGGFILVLIAIAIFIFARVLAILIRFALSRRREYLADAGAVELTKNPDALVSALRKIDGRSAVAAPPEIREMFFDAPQSARFTNLWESHPTIQSRIDALVRYAGARDPGPPPPPFALPEDASTSAQAIASPT